MRLSTRLKWLISIFHKKILTTSIQELLIRKNERPCKMIGWVTTTPQHGITHTRQPPQYPPFLCYCCQLSNICQTVCICLPGFFSFYLRCFTILAASLTFCSFCLVFYLSLPVVRGRVTSSSTSSTHSSPPLAKPPRGTQFIPSTPHRFLSLRTQPRGSPPPLTFSLLPFPFRTAFTFLALHCGKSIHYGRRTYRPGGHTSSVLLRCLTRA